MIDLKDVSKQYVAAGHEVTVLDGLDLAVDAGERVAIVGPSGSGKTTLLLLLTGLEEPSSGILSINGARLDALDRDQRADLRRMHIGIVFQSFHLIPTLTAAENIALPLEMAGVSDHRQRATEMLERVGLANRGHHYPGELSGGEQQRVAIARSVIHSPRLLVADEPTGNLDDHTGERVMQLLFDLHRESGNTMLLVTHDLELAARCDRTLRLHNGVLEAYDGQHH